MNSKIKPNFSKRTMIYKSETGEEERRNFVVVIIIDHETQEVLMQAFMNEKAWRKTQESGFVHFWSFSRNELWLKGETSGNKLEVKETVLDCDQDCIKIDVKVHGDGNVCHTGRRSCFMKQISIVVPDGSMQKPITNLFEKAGLSITVDNPRTKEGKLEADWISRVAFQRPQEIPDYLKNGHFDVAIVGEDWIANWGYEFPVLLKLPIGRSGNKPVKIVLAVSQNSDFHKPEDLPQGCEVATEYVQLVQRFFLNMGRSDIKIIPSYGNTEHKISFGATAIVDVIESGNSIRANGLKIIHTIMESNTVIVVNPESFVDESKKPWINCFVQLIKGAYQASEHVMLIANVPEKVLQEATQIIGGLKGPSCSSLMKKNWFALQSVIAKEDETKIIFALLKIGVTDIIVNREIPLIMS